MGFMEKVGATIATKYGTVIEGKHKDTVVALGNDPTKKVATSQTFEQIIFLDGTEEKGRYDIDAAFKEIKILEETEKGLKVLALFNDGEHFTLELEWKKDDGFAAGLLKTFLGAKKADATEQEKAEGKYRPIKVFMSTFFGKLSPDSAEFLLNFYKKHDILNETMENALTKLIQIYQGQN
ncbi:MAG: hypothetical protein J6B88_03205 [Clostridia bacterium]|nr:hypothetical protein [Clostridia bacterium]